MDTVDLPPRLSRAQAARLLGLSEKSIDRRCAEGLLVKDKDGGRAFITTESVLARLAQSHRGPTGEAADDELFPIPELIEHKRRKTLLRAERELERQTIRKESRR